MSYRFLQDEKGWRVFVSTAVMPTPTASDVRLGAIGVDFNVGFVSVTETDRFGNIVAHQDVPMVTAGLSKHATQTAISAAVQEIIAIACKAQKPISIEFLDFAKKKAQLSYASPGRQRMLSAFAYTRFCADPRRTRARCRARSGRSARGVQFKDWCTEIRSPVWLERSSRGSLRAGPARPKISRSLEAQQQKALRRDL
jgi:hypothetical protein